LLHDDFYDEDGAAHQAFEEVVNAHLFPCPTLAQVADRVDELVGYCLTRWHTTPEVIAALRHHAPASLLAEFRQRVQPPTNPGIIHVVFGLCGKAVGSPAAEFVREHWPKYVDVAFAGLAFAAAKCLPVHEGFTNVTAVLARLSDKARRESMYLLGWFGLPLTLEWIEENIREPVVEDWGRLAAASGMDWAYASKWLAGGRPLSLVALDALAACVRYDTPLLREQKPKLKNPPTAEEIVAAVTEYCKRDNVPRVQRVVSLITESVTKIVNGA
jgi:hypothetical protein